MGDILHQVFERLPFRFGGEAYRKRMVEAQQRGEKPVEVNCFGTDKYEIVGKRLVVKVFNPKLGIWEEHVAVEHIDICPICGRLMLVRAIKGTTYLSLIHI